MFTALKCEWIWERLASTHTKARHIWQVLVLKVVQAVLQWLVSEASQMSMSSWVVFEWLHPHEQTDSRV